MDMFKREMFFEVKNALQQHNVIFLLGPRKCGKTIALMQLNKELPTSELYDFKTVTKEESMDLVNRIIFSIKNNDDIIYLLDEVTYMHFVDVELAKIARLFTEQKITENEVRTKIVFTGSQSVALEAWGRIAFCNEARFIKSNFLSYREWLQWKNRTDISRQSYLEFINGTFEFYSNFSTLEEYLTGCLDETVISNANSRNYVYGNDCDLVDVEMLINILYSTLIKLHDNVAADKIFRERAFTDRIEYTTKQLNLDGFSAREIMQKVSSSILFKYDHVRSMDLETLKQCYAFLIRSDLIVATPIFSDLESSINVLKQLESTNSIFRTKHDLFRMVNFTIKYPMFYVEVLKELFEDRLPIELEGQTLGSIVECHVRGLLTSNGSFTYHDELHHEIDYVNIPQHTAIVITISNKKLKNVNLDLIDDSYKKILLTNDLRDEISSVKRIPYYEFIYELESSKSINLKSTTKINTF